MWVTIGHDRAVHALQRSLESGRFVHAYLLTGPPNVGKMTLALDMAMLMNCLEVCNGCHKMPIEPCGKCKQCLRIAKGIHADVHVVGLATEGSEENRKRVSIGINQVRQIQKEVSLKPYEGRCRVAIFDGVEQLTEEAANCLLKVLEEPPGQVVLVLLSTDSERVMPTIVSRCYQLALRRLPTALVAEQLKMQSGGEDEKVEETARLSRGRLGWALQALEDPDILKRRDETLSLIEQTAFASLEHRFSYAAELSRMSGVDRELAYEELTLWLEWWRDIMIIKEGKHQHVINLSRMDMMAAIAASLTPAEIMSSVDAILDTLGYLERNINSRLALEELMLMLPRPVLMTESFGTTSNGDAR